ncbi:MAG: type IV secretory system conjugative DNA transfer family protein [Muribaculaceae bacterium]|nr:type IV secretory system conjugative DNA transfer family protein [Muribaculaceae bacterium]
MVINDPKGELLVKNYVRGTVRGFTIVQFNLINPMKTDIYNPLSLAADAARDGNSTKCAMYVENIAEVFFPLDGGEDPLWPNAANNAFKRAAYGLIDYYLEEEKEMRRIAAVKNVNKKVLEQKIDEMWGKVTLYNCYQLFVQMSSKKLQDPCHVAADEIKAAEEAGHPLSAEEQDLLSNAAMEKMPIWDNAKESDMLGLFFNATAQMPRNSMRTLVTNADNALRAMGGAEKMIASVYGIAITAMSFFTDPTISTLTSGTISQNVDLAGLSFPRRFGVRFHMDYLKANHLVGMQCLWDAFEDDKFEKPIKGKDFVHEDTVSREGWARCFFKGCFKNDKAYIRLRLKDTGSEMLVKTFYFEFQKDYQTSYDGKTYMKDPILGTRIVKNGFLTELIKVRAADGSVKYKPAPSTFDKDTILNITEVAKALQGIENEDEKKKKRDEVLKRGPVKTNVFTSLTARYQEKCKMVFLVTPPHLMKYAKLILILIKQLVDLNFDQSYMTKSNQKPLYKTRYMLDELGNLQSEGHGISGFETMLSIGLGQEQQFTLILQTLQQLKDVYGDSVDKIVQGNTSNIVFLKSTDDSMIETLSKMSGTMHVAYRDSKTVTQDVTSVLKMTANEGKVSYTVSTVERPVIAYNDFAQIPPCNSIVFRAGDLPIWNRNETALPMSWRLFKNTITNPGKEYTLQTIPSLSTAKDFDVKQNQPNFSLMFEKRVNQAVASAKAAKWYKDVYGLTDDEIQRLDVDVYSDAIMEIASQIMNPEVDMTKREEAPDPDVLDTEPKATPTADSAKQDDSVKKAAENDPLVKKAKEMEKKIYAGGRLSPSDLMSVTGQVSHAYDAILSAAYMFTWNGFSRDPENFRIEGDTLKSASGTVYMYKAKDEDVQKMLAEEAKKEGSRVHEAKVAASGDEEQANYVVTKEFIKFLCSYKGEWTFAQGKFAERVAWILGGREAA